MRVICTALPEVLIVEPEFFKDDRGWFVESYNERAFHRALSNLGYEAPLKPLLQDNRSLSRKGVLRGLHYQRAPHAQDKLVSVTHGAIFDVAVDIRKNSKNFGKWVGVELSATNGRMLWVPAGFAHGFMSLQDDTQVHYKVSDYHAKESEGSINWADPQLSIEWPSNFELILSPKDRDAPLLVDALI